jgi:hypothetical protein
MTARLPALPHSFPRPPVPEPARLRRLAEDRLWVSCKVLTARIGWAEPTGKADGKKELMQFPITAKNCQVF